MGWRWRLWDVRGGDEVEVEVMRWRWRLWDVGGGYGM